jgi:hypothetical protein
MTLLNRAGNGHVASMMAVWRTMRALGPMSRDRLVALCGNHNAPDNKVSMTLATWRNLGMIKDEPDMHLAEPFSVIELDDVESLRTAVFDLLMQERNCPALLEIVNDELDLASDFVRVAAWCLAQDPYGMASWSDTEVLRQADAQNMNMPLWQGDGRWPSFRDWAYFCGLGMPTVHDFVLNPARAVRAALHKPSLANRIPLGRDIPIDQFIFIIADEVPVLEGGRHRKPIDERIGKHTMLSQEKRISACTSLALLQLDHEGELVLLDRPGDVATRYILLGRAERPLRGCSHVRRESSRQTVSNHLTLEVQS